MGETRVNGDSWDSPGHFLLQGIFLTEGSHPSLLHFLQCQVGSSPLSHLGSPKFATKGTEHSVLNTFSSS